MLPLYYDSPHFEFVYCTIEEKFGHVEHNNNYYQRIHGTQSSFENLYVS